VALSFHFLYSVRRRTNRKGGTLHTGIFQKRLEP
jgi:hypothetical protein